MELSRAEQEKEKRELEKVKIRLEEMGAAGGDEVVKEYTDASAREAFLERELADLETAAASLKKLIEDLGSELSGRFATGIAAVNEEFTKLFALMFDGGSASLVRVKESARKSNMISDEEVDGEAGDPGERIDEGVEASTSRSRYRGNASNRS